MDSIEDILRAIPPREIRRKQRALRRFHRYFYFQGDGLAYEATLRTLAKRAGTLPEAEAALPDVFPRWRGGGVGVEEIPGLRAEDPPLPAPGEGEGGRGGCGGAGGGEGLCAPPLDEEAARERDRQRKEREREGRQQWLWDEMWPQWWWRNNVLPPIEMVRKPGGVAGRTRGR